jgi:hypothetical protein
VMENTKLFVNCVQQCAQKLPRGSASGWERPERFELAISARLAKPGACPARS